MLKLVAGQLLPTLGEVRQHRKLRVAYYGQHTVDQLRGDGTAIDYLRDRFPETTVTDAHKTLAEFGLAHADRSRPLSQLSGGQRSRLVFATMFMQRPHLLVMDEPSNHLDMASVDALGEALEAFAGGVILSSHNSQLLSRVTNDPTTSAVWVVDDGRVDRFEGTFEDYRDAAIAELCVVPPS